MLKKLLIPFFVISVAAVASNGCGSSGGTTGTAGKGGTAGAGGTAGSGTAGSGTAGSGTAGSGTAGSGTAGAAAGTDGGSAGAAAGTDGGSAGAAAGTDGGSAGATAGTDGGSDASDGGGAPNVAALKLECPAKITAMNAATTFTADEFCALYADVCAGQTFTGMLTSANCNATYTGWASKKISASATVGVQNCTSYHLCNANAGDPMDHCKHAAALDGTPCAIAP